MKPPKYFKTATYTDGHCWQGSLLPAHTVTHRKPHTALHGEEFLLYWKRSMVQMTLNLKPYEKESSSQYVKIVSRLSLFPKNILSLKVRPHFWSTHWIDLSAGLVITTMKCDRHNSVIKIGKHRRQP